MKYRVLIENIFSEELKKTPNQYYEDILIYIENEYDEYLKIIDEANDKNECKKYISLIKFNLESIINLSEDDLKFKLYSDDNFAEFMSVSREIYQKAVYKKKKDHDYIISDEEKQRYRNKIDELFNKISDFNKKKAETVLSEIYMELEYLNGNNIISLRANRI